MFWIRRSSFPERAKRGRDSNIFITDRHSVRWNNILKSLSKQAILRNQGFQGFVMELPHSWLTFQATSWSCNSDQVWLSKMETPSTSSAEEHYHRTVTLLSFPFPESIRAYIHYRIRFYTDIKTIILTENFESSFNIKLSSSKIALFKITLFLISERKENSYKNIKIQTGVAVRLQLLLLTDQGVVETEFQVPTIFMQASKFI